MGPLPPLLSQLKAMGITLSVDDFGTGYSNLGYLHAFPLTRLKIDRLFIHGILSHQDNMALTEAMVKMGQRLGLEVLTEGVETEEEATYLQSIGCDCAQGVLICQTHAPYSV